MKTGTAKNLNLCEDLGQEHAKHGETQVADKELAQSTDP